MREAMHVCRKLLVFIHILFLQVAYTSSYSPPSRQIEEPEEEPLRKLAYQLENDIRSASRSTRGGQLPPRPNEAGVIGYVSNTCTRSVLRTKI